jgi:transketolase
MRTAFVETLCELAARDGRVMLLTADLGWSVLEPFAAAFPDRFLNVGVAEQNMLGLATGLALEGRVPFVYSIATFASMRGYEQFRNGAVLHRLPVRVIGIGGGFAYGHAGPTHHALEDLSIMRAQPGVTVLAPSDRAQARSAILLTGQLTGPVYLRIDKNPQPLLAGLNGRCKLDTPEVVRPGRHLLFVATGSVAHEAVRAAEILEAQGVSAAVAVLAHLAHQPGPGLRQLVSEYHTAITVEEGYAAGGLGSLVAEAIAQEGARCRLCSRGVGALDSGGSGSVEYLRSRHGLDAGGLAALAQELVPRRRVAA